MNLNALVASLSEEERYELLNILSATNEDVVEVTTPPPKASARDNNDFTMKSPSKISTQKKRRTPVKAQKNTWADTGEHRDVETPEVVKTPRNRKPPQKKTVTCSACGSKHEINANLVQGQYYRCERCVG